MTRFIQRLAVVATIFATLQLLIPSIAAAQQAPNNRGTKHPPTRIAPSNTGLFDGIYSSQTAARVAHPIAQGGTTGGTVNPALTGDRMHHGYNG